MHRLRGTLLLAVSLTAAGTAGAQSPHRAIRAGTQVVDTLLGSSPKLSERGGFRTYRFTASVGKRYVITMTADDFDAYVWVAREVGGLTDELDSDDDGGGGTNARLRFRPPADGSYLIVAQSLSEEGTGAFTLRLDETEPAVMPPAQPIRIGETLVGRLTDESPVDDMEGFPYAHYTLRGNGQRVRITMRAADFDAYLALLQRRAGGEEEVATNDDGAGGTDARITVTLDGEYRILARPLGTDGRGEFSVSVEEAIPVPVIQRPIRVGETLTGELTDRDPELDDGGFFHEYVLEANAGEEFRITLRSTEFDSYLRWGRKDGDAFTEIASDDDGGGNLDSQLTVRADARGRYVIRVSALGSDSVGPYELRVERGGR